MGQTVSGRSLVLLDVAAVVWVAACIALGLLISTEVRGLSRSGDAVVDVGRQVESVGTTLISLDGVPVVGERLGEAGESVRRAGARARRSGAEAQQSTESLSTVLGIAIIVIPAFPLLLFYLPLRVARARDLAALRALMARAADDPELEAMLARRALMTLPYRELVKLPGRPWADRADTRPADVEVAREVGPDSLWHGRERAG